MEKLIKVREFVERTGVPTDNVRRWFRGGELRGIQPGGKRRSIFIFESEIDRLLGKTEEPR